MGLFGERIFQAEGQRPCGKNVPERCKETSGGHRMSREFWGTLKLEGTDPHGPWPGPGPHH